MKISSIFYSIGQGLKNIKRNKLFSLASISTIAACVFLIGIFYSVVVNFQYIINQMEDEFSITVFFDEGVSETEIKDKIKPEIEKRVEVSEAKYTSAEEAWDSFKKIYFTDENKDLAEGFKDDNPLANSASLQIYLNDLEMHDSLVAYLEGLEGVRSVNAIKQVASTMSDFARLVGYVSVAIIAILFAVGIFLISNTISVGISVRKEEIGIMKLIGASDVFIKGPFMVEGLIIGLLGAIIPVVAISLIYEKIVVSILSNFQTLTSYFVLYPTGTILKVLAPVSLLIGAGIGIIGSRLTLRKHLKV